LLHLNFYIRILITIALIGLYLLIRELIKCRKRIIRGNRPRKESPKPCVDIPARVYRQADPLIYCQYFLMGQGLAVTWDNPDIHLELAGVTVSSEALLPGTKYDIVAHIWNGANDAPAINMQVLFSYLEFGIGTKKNSIGEIRVDLPANGAPGHPAQGKLNWTTPAIPGHYCIQVQLVWSDDKNPFNNLGQENVNVKPLNSPNAKFTFPVHNDSLQMQRIHLVADSYQIPDQDPCKEPSPESRDARIGNMMYKRTILSRHGYSNFPVPQNWKVLIEPSEFSLNAGDQRIVTVDITAPDDFTGKKVFNINAFNENNLTGGVSLYVHS
jgi:hypothetical protein